jgi:hypothetical protein
VLQAHYDGVVYEPDMGESILVEDILLDASWIE